MITADAVVSAPEFPAGLNVLSVAVVQWLVSLYGLPATYEDRSGTLIADAFDPEAWSE